MPYLPSKETLKLIGALLIGAVIFFGYQTVIGWKEAAEKSQQQTRTAGATVGILQDSEASAREQQGQDNHLSEGRETFNATIDEGRRNDPTASARADRAVPNSVRKAYRERRLTRERLGCAGAGCGKEPEDDTASER